MDEEERKGSQPTPFESNFNSLTNQIIHALGGTRLELIPIFTADAPPLRGLTLNRGKEWTRTIGDRLATIPDTPQAVLRSYAILTHDKLYEEAVLLNSSNKEELERLDEAADAVINEDKEGIEAKLIDDMRVALKLGNDFLGKSREKNK